MIAERKRSKNGTFLPSHGKTNTPLFRKWNGMKNRCNNPNCKAYPRYGGKGVNVCNEWEESFDNFYDWSIKSGYREGLTIDRIDNSKGYSPENCRWATPLEQARNTSNNRMITYKGKTQCISAWADEFGISRRKISKRIGYGWDIDKVFSKRDWRKDNG